MRRYRPGLCRVGEGTEDAFPNLRFRLPDELAALAALLRGAAPTMVEVHHLLGHHHAVLELAAPARHPERRASCTTTPGFCPRITLVGAARRYCGEPAQVADCEACVADAGSLHRGDDLRRRAARPLGRRFRRRGRVVVPSADAAARLRAAFPRRCAPMVAPHEDDAALPPLPPTPPPPRAGSAWSARSASRKGYEVLLDCARDAADARLPLEFVVVGHTLDDARLLATGRVFVTGRYRRRRRRSR